MMLRLLLDSVLWTGLWCAIYFGCVWLSGNLYVGGALTVVLAGMSGWLAEFL